MHCTPVTDVVLLLAAAVMFSPGYVYRCSALLRSCSASSETQSPHNQCVCLQPLYAAAVPMWLAETNVGLDADSAGSLTEVVSSLLSTAQPDQMTTGQGNLVSDMMTDLADTDSSITLDLTVDVGPSGAERVVRRGVTIGASDFGSSVADLTAEVDFEVAPDVSGESFAYHQWHVT